MDNTLPAGASTDLSAPVSKLTTEFIAQAEELVAWIELALAQIRTVRGAFSDLDISGLDLGHTLLRGRLIPAVRANLEGPLVAVFWGGTNTGKSTLINSIVREEASPPATTAGFTKHLIGAGGTPETWHKALHHHPDWRIASRKEMVNSKPPLRTIFLDAPTSPCTGLPLLLDTPDLDSSNIRCREQANLALELADMVVWVTTGQKYRDKSGIVFLNEAMSMIFKRLDVFNQALAHHSEAMEDMRRDYDGRWPGNERAFLCVEEVRTVMAGGSTTESSKNPSGNTASEGAASNRGSSVRTERLLPEKVVEELRGRLVAAASEGRALRARSGRFALGKAGQRLVQSATLIRNRRDACGQLALKLKERFEELLLTPLRNLPGHEAPIELQEAMVSIVGPQLKSTVGDILSRGAGFASNALAWAGEKLLGNSKNDPAQETSPALLRDRKDVTSACEHFERARTDFLQRSRERSTVDNGSFAKKIHEEVLRLDLPTGDELVRRMEAHLEEGRRGRLAPILTRFENDLEVFCRENKKLLAAMRLAIPGFSALAGASVAGISIFALAFLPGPGEYLVASVGLPVYRGIEGGLPGSFLKWADRLGREPFIRKSREAFIQTRREIFLETAEWITAPVNGLLRLPDLQDFDVAGRIEDLEHRWTRLYLK
ncbi:MAG: GTPase [Candidatus Ozemobacteraceae bacterium]